jgi:hypothetical protein
MKRILVQPMHFKKSGMETIKTQVTGMEAKTVTIIGELRTDDRFYFLNDSKKEVWTKEAYPPRVGSLSKSLAKRDNDKYPTPFNNLTQVVFLRHAN